MQEPPPLSQQQTIKTLLDRSGRSSQAVPLRRSFLEVRGASGGTSPGPLSKIVKHRGDRALELFLLAHVVTSSDKASGAYDVTEWSSTWARALGIYDIDSGMSAVSRVWKRLADERLITRSRGTGRRTKITVLREDGSDTAYTPPTGGRADPYFKVPFPYWTEEWHRRLTLPGKAILLISLSREAKFYLPHEQAAGWFGLSKDTIKSGLDELQRHDLLKMVERRYIPSLASPTGWTARLYYELRGSFLKDEDLIFNMSNTLRAGASLGPATGEKANHAATS